MVYECALPKFDYYEGSTLLLLLLLLLLTNKSIICLPIVITIMDVSGTESIRCTQEEIAQHCLL